jgi:hypothetical protein
LRFFDRTICAAFFCALAERINTVLKDGRLGQKIEEAA